MAHDEEEIDDTPDQTIEAIAEDDDDIDRPQEEEIETPSVTSIE